MNDSLTKLLTYIEPKILDIQDKREEMLSLKNNYNILKDLIDSGEKSYYDVINFYDQDFILECLDKLGNNSKDMFLSSKYLLKNRNENLLELPQYKSAVIYMEKLFTYFNDLYLKTKLKYDVLEEELKKLELLNKYYLLFKKNNFLILDIEEFLMFLQFVNISLEDKYKILIMIAKFNVKEFTLTNDILLDVNIYLSDITNLLTEFKKEIDIGLLNKKELEVDNKILFKENKDNLFLKRKYIITKLSYLYENHEYDKLSLCYKEYLEIEEFIKQIEYQGKRYNDIYYKKIIFVRKNNGLLIQEYLDNCLTKYKSCVYKNLLDIEINEELVLPDFKVQDKFFYLKNEFIVKTIYTFLDNGVVLVLGATSDNPLNYIEKNIDYVNKMLKNIDKFKNINDRDLLLKNIKVEDLILTIDLDTLNMEE